MSGIDWKREYARVTEATEAAASGDIEEMARTSAVEMVRMMGRTGGIVGMNVEGNEWAQLLDSFGTFGGYEIAHPVVQYGPFRLHPYLFINEGGTRTPRSWYQVVLGAVGTPIIMSLDAALAEPERYREQQRELTELTALGSVPIAASGLTDVARHVRLRIVLMRERAAYDRELQATHPDRAEKRTGRMAEAERRVVAWEAGLRELEAEYGGALAVPEANLSADEREREVREMRRRIAVLDEMHDYAQAQLPPAISNTAISNTEDDKAI